MIDSQRNPSLQAAVLLIAACAFLTTGTISCSSKVADQLPAPEPIQLSQGPGFSVPAAGSLVLLLGSTGQLELLPEATDRQAADPGSSQGPEPAPFAIQTAISAVLAPIDGGVVVAINRTGLVFLDIHERQVMLRRIPGADSEFAGRSVAQGWTWNGKALFLLHRNEIFETAAAQSPVARVIAVTSDKALALPAFGIEAGAVAQEDAGLYGSLYAVFPRTSNRWLVQFRLADQEKILTAFAAWNPGPEKLEQWESLEPLDRSVYEANARPAPMKEAPPAMRLAADALGGSLLLDAVLPDGSQLSWLHGDVETALAVRGWAVASTFVALASDGRIVLIDADGTHQGAFAPPVPRAYFRDLVMIDGFLVALWEEDLFPNLGRSGLVIMDLSLLKG